VPSTELNQNPDKQNLENQHLENQHLDAGSTGDSRGTELFDPQVPVTTTTRSSVTAILLLMIPILFFGSVALFSAGNEPVYVRPLDLPSGGGGFADGEEDAPETIIFYGMDYEGDAFFWCLDKSGSMDWGGAMEDLKQEVTAAVLSLSPSAEFSIVAFSSNTVIWSPTPRPAKLPEKTAALAWVNSLGADGWTCLAPAAVTTLNICNQSSHGARQVIILSDGAPFCNEVDTSNQALSEITGANWQQVPIHTVFIGSDMQGIDFMQSLAAMNQGSFHICEN